MKKIAVFLPAPYRGGSLRGLKNIIRMIQIGSQSDGEKVEIVLSCLADTYNIEEEFAELISVGVSVRETIWKTITQDELDVALTYCEKPYDDIFNSTHYTVPDDGINNFYDCDFWIIISDRLNHTIAPLRPYAMVIYDYIQRYIPEIFGTNSTLLDAPFINSARCANKVLCTTPQTKEDAISYAGIDRDNIVLLPMEFDPVIVKETKYFKDKFDYFIWTTNSTQHKNHLLVLDSLEKYYKEHNGKFKIVITGVQSEMFQKKYPNTNIEYINKVKNTILKSKVLSKNIMILGELDDIDYISVLKGAKALLHAALYDNGTFSVIEAAYNNTPSLSSTYPQMEYINDRFSLNTQFFDSTSSDSLSEKFKDMEDNHKKYQEKLPSKDFLKSFSYEKLANNFWKTIKEIK